MSVALKSVKQGNYPFIAEREKAVDKALNYIATCPYKGTAIKIELEAYFGREGQNRVCGVCNASGNVYCTSCNGTLIECDKCKNSGYVKCDGCDGKGMLQRLQSKSVSWCHDFIVNAVPLTARNALIYAKTYHDMSVDTEFTFTLPLAKARYAIEFIRAFNKLGEAIGAPPQVGGAGMHICILNSPNGTYPAGNGLDSRRAQNFKYSMTKLLPALFFLASSDYRSRRLNYRRPQVTLTNKYGAISGEKNCFEYRVFETCYQRPEAILDNICVIANTLKYYSYRKITHSFFGKIGKFGFRDVGQGLERFYDTETNYKALMAGVNLLKPAYKSMLELRRERNFKLTLIKIKRKEAVKERVWKSEYKQEAERSEKRDKDTIAQITLEYAALLKNPSQMGFSSKAAFKRYYPTLDSFLKGKYIKRPKFSEKQFINDKKLQEQQLITETLTI